VPDERIGAVVNRFVGQLEEKVRRLILVRVLLGHPAALMRMDRCDHEVGVVLSIANAAQDVAQVVRVHHVAVGADCSVRLVPRPEHLKLSVGVFDRQFNVVGHSAARVVHEVTHLAQRFERFRRHVVDAGEVDAVQSRSAPDIPAPVRGLPCRGRVVRKRRHPDQTDAPLRRFGVPGRSRVLEIPPGSGVDEPRLVQQAVGGLHADDTRFEAMVVRPVDDVEPHRLDVGRDLGREIPCFSNPAFRIYYAVTRVIPMRRRTRR
jgi:hypothetical protein